MTESPLHPMICKLLQGDNHLSTTEITQKLGMPSYRTVEPVLSSMRRLGLIGRCRLGDSSATDLWMLSAISPKVLRETRYAGGNK